MAKFPTYEEMAKEVAEKALDEYIYKGKTLREWIEILSQTRWIPASERLPEEGVDVLACFYTGEGNYKMMVSRRSDYNYWGGVGRTSDMVAWMPLPEPYNADQEDAGGINDAPTAIEASKAEGILWKDT